MFVTRVFFDAARSSAASPSVSSLFFHSGPHSFVSSSRDSSPNDISLFFATTRARASIDNFLRTYYTRESKKRKKRHTHNHTNNEKQRKKERKKRERRDQKAHFQKKKRRLETTTTREPEERIFERTQQKRRQATGDDYNIYCMLYFSLLL